MQSYFYLSLMTWTLGRRWSLMGAVHEWRGTNRGHQKGAAVRAHSKIGRTWGATRCERRHNDNQSINVDH